MNLNVGKRGENLVRNTFFKSNLIFPPLYSRYRGKFSSFRTLWTKKSMSFIDAEVTIIDTPLDVQNYAQLKFEEFHRRKCKEVSLWCFFEKKTFCRRMNRNVGKRDENLVRDTFFKSSLKFPPLYSRYRGNFSSFRTLWPKKAMSLIYVEFTIIDTPLFGRSYAQLEFEKFHRKKCQRVSHWCFFEK